MSETLTIKEMQSHVVKTILGSVITSAILAIGTGIIFYFKTNSAIERLNENQDEIKKTTVVHTEQINKTNTSIGINDVQLSAFEKRLNNIEEGQKEILKVLIEIKNKQ